jgi:hypothetical protein
MVFLLPLRETCGAAKVRMQAEESHPQRAKPI